MSSGAGVFPFVIGGLIGIAFAFWFSHNVSESSEWEKTKPEKTGVFDVFRKGNIAALAQIFVLMSGIWLSQNMVGAALPALLRDPVGISDDRVTLIMLIANFVLIGGYLGAGALSQIVGRRTYFIATGTATATVVPMLYGMVVSGSVSGFGMVLLVVTLINLLTGTMWGVVATYINERFAIGVRSTGFGLGYSLAVIIPSFYAFYQAGSTSFMAFEYTPLVLLTVAGLLILVGTTSDRKPRMWTWPRSLTPRSRHPSAPSQTTKAPNS